MVTQRHLPTIEVPSSLLVDLPLPLASPTKLQWFDKFYDGIMASPKSLLDSNNNGALHSNFEQVIPSKFKYFQD